MNKKQKEAQEKQYRDQAKYRNLFSINTSELKDDSKYLGNSEDKLKKQYAELLKEQIQQTQRQKEQTKERERLESEQQMFQVSPFGKERVKQLERVRRELLKPISDIDEFVKQKNQTDFSRPKTILKNPSTERTHNQISHENSQEYIPNYSNEYQNDSRVYQNDSRTHQQTQFQQTRNSQRIPQNRSTQSLGLGEPVLFDESNQYGGNNQQRQVYLPPKTPGMVYDNQNNPKISEYVSIYDQQFSRLHKSEKSDFMKELNNLNLRMKQQSQQQYFPLRRIQEQPIQTSPKPLQDQITQDEINRQEQLERERLQELQRQQEQQRLIEEQRRKQQEEFEQQMRERIERELEEQKRLRQQDFEVQTEKQVTNTGIQHVDHNAVTATEYMNSLKQLSGSVIDMKNQFIQGQQKLNYELIQLKDKAQRDYEEKLRIQKELKELEHRHQAMKIWEGERQRQLMQALEKNAPIPQYKSAYFDPKQINPTLKKVTRFKDQTQGYEYDESNPILSKSNLMPLRDGLDQRHLNNLKAQEPVLPEELEVFREEVAPQLKYSNPVTKSIRIDDLNDQYYDYKYRNHMIHPGKERQEILKQETQLKNDPNRILLENDRRMHELSIIDPNGDQEKISELYKYL